MLEHLLQRWQAIPMPVDALEQEQLLILGLEHNDFSPERQTHWQNVINQTPCPVLILANSNSFDLPPLRLTYGGETLYKPFSRDQLATSLDQLLLPALVPSKPADHPNLPPTESSVLKLLIVDDNAPNRELLKSMLESPTIHITAVESGHHALEFARNHNVDMVLMDIRMPGLDGVQTTHALRRLSSTWARCPIVAVTAHVLSSEREKWLAEGLDDVLIKPIDETQLHQLLSRFLSHTHRLADFRTPPSSPMGAKMAIKPRYANTKPATLPVVDLELGAHLAGGKDYLAREQLKRLIDGLDESEKQMRSAYSQQNLATLLDWVHGLNGASRYCGAPELALLVETLETRLRTSGLDHVHGLLEDLYRAMAKLRTYRPLLLRH